MLALLMLTMTASAVDAPTFTLTKGTSEHGTITFKVKNAEVTTAKEGDKVTVTVSPNTGYVVGAVTGQWEAAVAASRSAVPIDMLDQFTPAANGTNTWTFTMKRANVTVSVSYKRTLQASMVQPIADVTYNGSAQTPAVILKDGDKRLVLNKDYTVKYANNKNAGTATATITGIGDYSGTVSKTFTIQRKPVTVSGIKVYNKVYNGTDKAIVNLSNVVLNGTVKGDNLTISGITGTFSSKTPGTGKTVTLDYTNAMLGGPGALNYQIATSGNQTTVKADINKKTLYVTANDKTINYGDAPSNDGVTYSGFVNNETASVLGGSLTYAYNSAFYGQGTPYTAGSPAGTYYIIPSGLSSNNYAISYKAGTLTVGEEDDPGSTSPSCNGDVFTNKNLVLQELCDGTAAVIGVASHNGTIVIPDEVLNPFDNDKPLKVTRLQAGWWLGGQLVLRRDGGQEIAGTTVAKNLLDGGPFTLKIEATQLKDIAMQEIVPINGKISAFIVTPEAGLNMLPEHAFQKNETIIDEAKTAANQAAHDVAVAKAEAALNGGDEEVCYIQGGLLGTQQVYTDGESYYVIGTEAAGTDFAGKTIYDLFLIDEDGTVAETASGLQGYVGASGDIKLNTEAEGKINVASKVEGDVCATVHTNSPAEDVAAAELAKELAEQKAEQAHQAAVNAEYAANHPESNITPEKLAKKAAAERLEAAILAFKNDSYWKSLQKKVSQKTGTNVELVDAWTAAYVLANDPDNTLLQLSNPTYWSEKTEEFIEAYVEFYGKEPRIVSEMQVQSYTFNSFGATGDIFHAGQAAVDPTSTQGASQITFTPWANGLVEDRSQYDNYDVTAQANGYYQIKVLENSVEDFVNKYYYVKVAPENIDEENTYYVLYEKKDGQIVPVGTRVSTDLEGNNYSEVAVVKIKKDQLMTVARILPVPTEIDAFNPSGDIRAAIAAGTADQDALDEAAAQALLDEQEAIAAAKQADKDLKAAKKTLKNLQAALTAAQNAPVETVYMFEFGGDNDWLTNVQWDNDGIADFGAYAFKDCVKAKFSNNGTAGLFPSNTNKIGEEAFLNCKELDADLKNTNNTISSIGNAAFKNTKTTTVALKDATKLADGNIGADVWDNTPMVTINLLNTKLTEMPEGLAEDIQRTDDAKDCNNNAVVYKYKEDGVEKTITAKVNKTLTTVVMPKDSKKIRDINFWFCEKLNSITIPAGVTYIGEYALAGTSLTGLNLTALTGLDYVGDGAFAFNPLMTSVKFAPTAPFENLEGDVFRCDNSLEEIVLNDSIKCLPAGLFADTQIKKLDLSKSQVQMLPDLFWGSAEKVTASATTPNITSSLKTILLPETKMNATNDEVLIPGLKIIGNHAFAYLQGITKMTIPSSVWAMGNEVFAYCTNLTQVTAMDSRLTNLGHNSFINCTSLKKFTFVTLQRIDPTWKFIPTNYGSEINLYGCELPVIGGMFNFDDSQFYLCNEGEPDGKVQVIVTEESRKVLDGQWYKSYNGTTHYSELKAFQPTMTVTKPGTDPEGNATFSDAYASNEFYGMWIPIEEATVFTAYQDTKNVYLFRAKHNDGYYKVPALNSQPDPERFVGELPPYVEPSTISWGSAPYWLTKGAVQKNIWHYDADAAPLTEVAQGSPAVIIITKKANGKFKYERHSAPGEKYQSTLDRDNELKIAGCTIKPDVRSRACVWAKVGDKNPTFYRLDQAEQVIPNGKVVFPLSSWQGGANSRIEVIFVNDEVTSIKDYVKAINSNDSEAIYNLQGIRVSTPQKGQMYIKGGEKFIQK